MRAALFSLASMALATSLLLAQEPRGPQPAPPASPGELPPGAVRVPLGVREAKPEVPTPERLIERSKTASVDADSIWMVIEHAKRLGITTVDVRPDGSCDLIERRFNEDGSLGALLVRSGASVPKPVSKRVLDLARQRSVIYGTGRDRLLLGAGRDRLRFGLSSNNGASVYGSQSAAFDEYSADVRRATIALVESARKLPLNPTARGVISAEFIDPRQVMRLTTINGKKMFPVPDSGKTEGTLPPLVAVSRMPGRKIVVSDAELWQQMERRAEAGGGGPFLITVGRDRYFRVFVEPVTAR